MPPLLFLTFSALVASPKKLLYTVASPARGLLNREKKKKKKSGSAPPPPTRCSFGEKKEKEKKRNHAAHPHVCLGATQVGVTQVVVSVRLASVQGFLRLVRGQWVSLRKNLRFRVRLQLSQSRCLSLLLAMSGRVFLFFPPRGHEPPPTLRDRLNPNLSL